MKNSVLIVDDHTLFREGLRLLLKGEEMVSAVYEASNGIEFLESLKQVVPDIVFMDIEMPGMNGIEATRRAMSQFPQLKIVGLSMYGEEEYYAPMMEAGACGFISKNAELTDILEAIRLVSSGRHYFNEDILRGIIRGIGRREATDAGQALLSERERQVVLHICKGLSNQEIADILFLSRRTIEKHREHILQKTGVPNTAALVAWAIRTKVIEL
jgi:DNA-binding NarL/FixJ family response regulator